MAVLLVSSMQMGSCSMIIRMYTEACLGKADFGMGTSRSRVAGSNAALHEINSAESLHFSAEIFTITSRL